VPGDGTRSVSDVLIGELWLGAGQSNMQITVGASRDGQLSIAEDDCRELRFFDVERNALATPGDDVNGAWKVCTPDTARSLSAVGCYFARDSPHASRSRDEHLGEPLHGCGHPSHSRRHRIPPSPRQRGASVGQDASPRSSRSRWR